VRTGYSINIDEDGSIGFQFGSIYGDSAGTSKGFSSATFFFNKFRNEFTEDYIDSVSIEFHTKSKNIYKTHIKFNENLKNYIENAYLNASSPFNEERFDSIWEKYPILGGDYLILSKNKRSKDYNEDRIAPSVISNSMTTEIHRDVEYNPNNPKSKIDTMVQKENNRYANQVIHGKNSLYINKGIIIITFAALAILIIFVFLFFKSSRK
jgi:hypothetical protein